MLVTNMGVGAMRPLYPYREWVGYYFKVPPIGYKVLVMSFYYTL